MTILNIFLALILVKFITAQQQTLHLNFNSQPLSSNSLLLLTEIGEDTSTLLQCLTSRSDCCDSNSTGSVGIGNWVSPSGTNLQSLDDTPAGVDFYQERGPRRIDLLRKENGTSPEGIYRCDVPSNSTNVTNMVYVGLYHTGNGAPVVTNVTFDIPSLSIVCTSSGGPATLVTWTRNELTLSPDAINYTTTQAVTDMATGSYVNTLTATSLELLQGNFTCIVSNLAGNSSEGVEVMLDAPEVETTEPPVATTNAPPASSGVYLSVNFVTYGNNSLIPLSAITESLPLLCVTDSEQCCRSADTGTGAGIGQWFYPNRTLVQISSQNYGLYRSREQMTVRMHRRMDVVTDGGIFQCEIRNMLGEEVNVYVGVYPDGEGIVEVTSVFYEEMTFTLICTSSGGPVSNVAWLRDGITISPEDENYRMSQRITSTSSSTYISLLAGITTGSLLGNFTCIVENDRGTSNKTIELITDHPPAPVISSIIPDLFSASIAWSIGNSFVREYLLTYAYMGSCPEGDPVITMTVSGILTTVTIPTLRAGTNYSGSLTSINDRGRSESTNFTFATSATAPSGVVTPLTTVTMTMINVTWERVTCLLRNNDIRGYSVMIESRYGTTTRLVLGTENENRTAVFTNLIPNTLYDMQIATVTVDDLVGPEILFNATTLPVEGLVFQLNGVQYGNNSVIDPRDIGEDEGGLFCLTNNFNCCRSGNGFGSRGEWYDSRGQDIPTMGALQGDSGFYNNRGTSAVRLNRVGTLSASFPSEIFWCEIPDGNDVLQVLFLGLYLPNSGAPVITELIYDSLSTSLTCTTSEGPIITVTWTQDQLLLENNGNTVESYQQLNVTTAVYKNVLRLGREDERDNVGTYRCDVNNSRGNQSMELRVAESRIVGDLDSILLGVPFTLRCAGSQNGILNSRIEWVDGVGDVIRSEENVSEVTLVFNPVNLTLNNTEYTCRISNHVTTRTTLTVQASGPPLAFSSVPIETGFNFSWAAPDGAIPVFFSYLLSCEPMLTGIATPTNISTGLGETSAAISNLEDGGTYTCTVYAIIEGYTSEPQVIIITRVETAPTGFPSLFTTTNIATRDVTFSWQPLPVLDRNGVISGYTVSCNSSGSNTDTVAGDFANHGSNTLRNFRPNTTYGCLIFASNSAGRGPTSVTNFNTSDEKLFFQLELSSVSECLGWVAINSQEKVSSIRSEIVNNINQRCSNCQLTLDRVTSSVLQCFQTSPQTVTYRATIHGTEQRTSADLVEEIEDWVASEAPMEVTIPVLSVTMSLVSSCQVEIGSYDEDKCSNGEGTASPFSLPIIAGAGVGGVILVTVFCIIVILVVLAVQKRRSKRKGSRNLRRNNLDEMPYMVQLPTVSSGIYEPIGPRPPPPPPRILPTTKEEEECTAFENMHHRTDSSGSEKQRYVPAPGEPVPESEYSEIDGGRRRRERLPSDYESVFVHNVGFVSTEELNTIRTSDEKEGENGETEEQELKLQSSDLPPVNPMVSNNYEIVKNLGFHSTGNTPPEGSGGQPNDIEVIKNESYTELPPPRAFSVSTNPMYSTGAVVRGMKELKERNNNHSTEVNGPNSKGDSLYEVPPDDPPSLQRVNGPPVNPNYSTYDVPSSNPRETDVVNDSAYTRNPNYAAYDVPPNNPREKISTEVVNIGGSSNSTYDVPPKHPQGNISTQGTSDLAPPHANLIMYDIPPNNPREKRTTEKVNDGFYKYDIPPSNMPAPKLVT